MNNMSSYTELKILENKFEKLTEEYDDLLFEYKDLVEKNNKLIKDVKDESDRASTMYHKYKDKYIKLAAKQTTNEIINLLIK